jgi:hypothetical protein
MKLKNLKFKIENSIRWVDTNEQETTCNKFLLAEADKKALVIRDKPNLYEEINSLPT